MAVDLTALPATGGSKPIAQLFGGSLAPPLGGPVQHIDRAGSRWSWRYVTPLMDEEPDGRIWRARLTRAVREGGLIAIPQPDLVIGNPGAPVVSSLVAAGRLIGLSGLTAGYTIREGQWISFVVAGQRYADQARSAVTANGAGVAAVTLQNLLRLPLASGVVAEIAEPKLQGTVSEDFGGEVGTDRMTGFDFVISEDA